MSLLPRRAPTSAASRSCAAEGAAHLSTVDGWAKDTFTGSDGQGTFQRPGVHDSYAFDMGGSTRFSLNLSCGAKAGDTITLSFSGASGCKAILGDTTVEANGAVITLAEGQTRVSFSLVHDGQLSADAQGSLSASYSGNGQSATSNTWQIDLRDGGEAENTFNGDYVVVTEKNTGVPITRINTQGVEVTVVDTNELKYEADGQNNLKAGTTAPTQRPIYNEQGEVIGMETIPSNAPPVTDNDRCDAANQGVFICAA